MTRTIQPIIAIAVLCCCLSFGAFAQNNLEAAQAYLAQRAAELGVSQSDIDLLTINHAYTDPRNGLTHLYLVQAHQGIEVHNAILNIHFLPNGEVVHLGNRMVPDLLTKLQAPPQPSLTAEQAVASAADQLGYSFSGPLAVLAEKGGPASEIVFAGGDLSYENIPVKRKYQPMEDGTVRLAWDLNIAEPSGMNWWSVRVDAHTGEILGRDNWTVTCNFGEPHTDGGAHGGHEHLHTVQTKKLTPPANPFMAGSYNVFAEPAESPSHTSPPETPTLIADPDDPTASPYGWHDTDGANGAEYTITRGNNVYAQLDDDANNNTFGYAPDGGPSLVFDYDFDFTLPPDDYVDGAVTNLFYWNSYIHDFAYQYGFTPVNGNFQENNYGGGGAGSDGVVADAQDAVGTNNANFSTPPDGSNPRMQMFIWTGPNPDRDSDVDNGIIAHEYGHGISNRYTGGPLNTGCLGNAEQMGEGWSDWYALMTSIEPGDQGTDGRGIGTYVLGQPTTGPGIRPTRYSTDLLINPTTYGDIPGLAIPHGVGYAWCGMIWDLTWALIEEHGQAAGFDLAMNMVNTGMQLQPCSPGFVNGRDAIIAADQALNMGENRCLIWDVFARRGLGFSASQGSSNSTTDGTEAFDTPPSCDLTATNPIATICQPANANYNIEVGLPGTSTLSVTGNPAGTTISFSVNPVNQDGTSILTIGNTAAAVPGSYVFSVSADNGTDVAMVDLTLNIYDLPPLPPLLLAPADLAINQSLNPVFTWAASDDTDEYALEVSTNVAFTDLVIEEMGITDTSFMSATALDVSTTYFWRVTSANPCGDALSIPFSFTTGSIVCDTWMSTDVPVAIPTVPATVTSDLIITVTGPVTDVDIVGLNVTHTWVDDLEFELTDPAGAITVLALNRPCGSQNNILMGLDDESNLPYNSFPCPPTNGLIYQPFELLSAFDGSEINGTWVLTVNDLFNQDGGSLNAWGLQVCYIDQTVVPCSITAITLSNQTACNDNNTPETGDDFFTADVTVAFSSPPATGSLELSGSGSASVLVGSMDGPTSHTFTGLVLPANGTGISLTAHFSADLDCTFSDNFPAQGPCSCGLVINEVDYDQPGTDNAEFIELYNPCTYDVDLDGYTIELVNGAGGGASVYSTITLQGGTLPAGDYYVICANGTNTPNCDVLATPATNFIQDGAPDAIGLRLNGQLVDALSYEGNTGTPYTEGSGSGLEDNGNIAFLSISRIPNGVDTDMNNVDFSARCATPGAVNSTTLPTVYYADSDGDTYGNPAVSQQACSQPGGYVTNNGDCNDSNSGINPAATEVCNGIDDDCDTMTDEGVTTTYYQDSDGDTFGNPAMSQQACTQPVGYVADNTDCDDTDANEKPGQTWYLDADGDDYSDGTSVVQCLRPANHFTAGELTATSGDCNDSNSGVNPAATEVCNGIDDDCDAMTDEGVTTTYYADSDGDNFGNPSVTQQACTQPTGFVADNTDCDDTDANEKPGQTWYLDADGDDYSDGTSVVQCLRPANHFTAGELTATSGDCNDGNSGINPAATEVCNGTDDDCDTMTDEGVTTTYYADSDGDNFGNPSVTQQACSPPVGYVADNTDCDDTDANEFPGQTWYLDADGDDYSDGTSVVQCLRPANYFTEGELTATSGDCNDGNSGINPAATEVCNGTDDDCDTMTDEGVTTTYYADSDGDGFGNPAVSQNACTQPGGHVANSTDCDDTDANEFPGQTWYLDADGDDYSDGTSVVQCLRPANYFTAGELTATSGDCDDSDSGINPAATEICDDLDNDCNGSQEAATNTWDGGGNGTTWDDADNWSDGIVPLECQNVVVPAGFEVSVPAGFEGKGLTLEVATGSLLTVASTALLTILP